MSFKRKNMDDIEKLKHSLIFLRKSVSEFPIGVVTLEDYDPIDKKIDNIRESLKCINSRMKMLQIKTNLQIILEPLQKELNDEIVNQLQDKISDCIINNSALMLCHHSQTAQKIFFNQRESANDKHNENVKTIMQKLYNLNDTISTVNDHLTELLARELELKDDRGRCVTEFHDFLKEQQAIRYRRLGESNPVVVEKKEKQKMLIFKMNLMKKLITNFISAASRQIVEKHELQELLKKHRDLVTDESIRQIAENNIQDREEN